jgi:hypothetical protein
MRYFGWLLIAWLLQAQSAQALDFFADFLYWQATEPVDWTLDTNRFPLDQFVAYETVSFDFTPGFRVGVGQEGQWSTKVYYSHVHTSFADSMSGNLTPAFLGGKLALSDEPKSTPAYFDQGQIEAAVDYNVLDWDLGKPFNSGPSLRVQPLVGLRAAWITQTFDSGFQGEWPDLALSKSMTEHMKNDFWGIGPKIGIENAWNVARGEVCEINCVANFYTAYLLGHWTVKDVTDLSTIHDSQTSVSQRIVPIDGRDFGAVTFQAVVGINLKYRRWSATAGYEINDWLNQCQIFDDATGPHNNDLILQGLTVNVACSF